MMMMIFYEIELTKNICCKKDEGTVDHNTITRCFKKFSSDYKNLNNQARSDRAKNMDSKAILQAIEEN